MNKKLLLVVGGVALVGIIILVAGSSRWFGGDTIEGDTLEDFRGSVSDLYKLGKDITCTFERSDDAGTMSGTVYVTGEKMRGDFQITQAGGESFDSHTISDGEWIYTWGATQLGYVGTKIKITETEDVEQTGEASETPNLDEEFDYKCNSWNVDNSLLVPPSDIEFQDLSATMQQLQEQSQSIQNTIDCSMCDSVPAGEAREQCRQSLGC